MTRQTPVGLATAIIMVIGQLAAGVPALADTNQADISQADSVFKMAQAYTLEGPTYVFDVAFDIDGVVAMGTVNLTANEGERLTIHSPPRDQWNKEFASEVGRLERNLQDDIWCQDMMNDIGAYKTVTRSGDTLTYVVAMAVDSGDNEDEKFAKHVVTTVTLSTDDGAVLDYSMHAPKPFRPMMVAKINRLDVNISCARSPDGRTYAKSMRADVEGRALMKKFSEHENREITNLRRP